MSTPDPLAGWDVLVDQVQHHLIDEETYLWPALWSTDADLSRLSGLCDEHDALRATYVIAAAAVEALRSAPGDEHAVVARRTVAHVGEILRDHLAHEERDLAPVLAAYGDRDAVRTALEKMRLPRYRDG